MKPTLLGLIVSAVAFAGSTFYFWQQLQTEREGAATVAAQTLALKQRIADLEQVRDGIGSFEFEGPLPGSAGGTHASATSAEPATGPAKDPEAEGGEPPNRFQARPHEPTPAMQKMMRAQIRANNKRMYADLVAQMGLSEDEANKFYDLLTEQQAANFGQARGLSPEESRAKFDQARKQTQAAIEDLLGTDKLATFKEYQETMNVRGEVDMIARQMDAMEHALTTDQRKKLVTALIEEQKRVPAPDYSSFGDNDLYNKALTDWQTQYNERATDRARSILNTEQFSSYSEYQQWQAEMRENFRSMPGRRNRGAMVGGAVNSVTITAAPGFIGPAMPAPPPRDNE